MAQQTINVGASPNDGTGTPLRTAFQYTNSNFSELYTAVGPSGNNIVCPGSATITGDLTVDTSTLKVDSANDRVGVGTASPAAGAKLGVLGATSVSASDYIGSSTWAARFIGSSNGAASGISFLTNSASGLPTPASLHALPVADYRSALVATYSADPSGAGYFAVNRFNPTASTTSEHYKIDNAGVATWSNVGGVAGTAMTLNSTGLGIGAAPEGRLNVANTAAPVIFSMTLVGAQRWQQIIDTTAGNWTLRDQSSSIDALIVKAGSGNLGVGVTPSAWASGNKFIDINSSAAFGAFGSSDAMMIGNAYWNGSSWIRKTANNAWRFVIESVSSTPTMTWQLAANGSAGSSITWTQAMTLDASGSLLVGTTNNVIWNTTNQGCVVSPVAIQASRSNDSSLLLNRIASDGAIAQFAREGVSVGYISVTTSGTTYNTISDYRLKEQVQPLVGGLARISALKPSIYKWKADGSNGEGFIAHELAEVVPAAVTGEKDAVNDDGSIKAQGVDLSKVVPILVAAIQELTARVQTLETR